jgi:flagellar M-ring protein FliF
VESVTIAVVVNRKRLLASLGENPSPEAIDKQLKEVERLAGSAAGIDMKRGDRITVAAVEFVQSDQILEPVASVGLFEHLVRQAGTLVNAAAMITVTALLIWFGIRPAMRAILETRPGDAPQARELRAEASAGHAAAARIGEPEPNLIADLTSKRARTPQKRLEQMIDLDEAQAATVLKQWMRGAKSA